MIYWVVQVTAIIANHAAFSIQIRKITVQSCGNFWVPQYITEDLPSILKIKYYIYLCSLSYVQMRRNLLEWILQYC